MYMYIVIWSFSEDTITKSTTPAFVPKYKLILPPKFLLNTYKVNMYKFVAALSTTFHTLVLSNIKENDWN